MKTSRLLKGRSRQYRFRRCSMNTQKARGRSQRSATGLLCFGRAAENCEIWNIDNPARICYTVVINLKGNSLWNGIFCL